MLQGEHGDVRDVPHGDEVDAGRQVLATTSAPAYRDSVAKEFAAALSDRDIADLKRIGRKPLEAHGKWDAKRFATD